MNYLKFPSLGTPAPKDGASDAPAGERSPVDKKKVHPDAESQPDEVPDPLDDASSLESKPDLNRPLNEAKCYNKFLLKVGFEFVLFYMALSAAILFVLLDVRRSRVIYRNMYLDILLWVFLGICILLKLVSSFLGPWIRPLLKPFFFLDMAAAAIFTVGLYYFLQERMDTSYYTYSPFVIVFVFNLLVASILFTITTFYKVKRRRYNFILGIIFMTLGTTATSLGLFFGWKSVVTITVTQYIIIMIIMAVYNFYFSINAWMVVKFRSGEVLEHDSVLVFFRFWTDIFFVFWKDLLWGKKHSSFFANFGKELVPGFGKAGEGGQAETADQAQAPTKPVRRPRVRNANEVTSSVASHIGPKDEGSEICRVYIA
jgi:hypothetical protein